MLRLESAIIGVYGENNKAVLTPDVGGSGTLNSFADGVIKRL